MGWQDDPIVDPPMQNSGGWQDDPIVEAPTSASWKSDPVVEQPTPQQVAGSNEFNGFIKKHAREAANDAARASTYGVASVEEPQYARSPFKRALEKDFPEVPFDSVDMGFRRMVRAYRTAQVLAAAPPSRLLSETIASKVPAEDRNMVAGALHELASEKQTVKNKGFLQRAGENLVTSSIDMGGEFADVVGIKGGLDEDQTNYAKQLLGIKAGQDPLRNPNASVFNPLENLVSVAGMTPKLVASSVAASTVGGATATLGAGEKLTEVAAGVGGALVFYPKMQEDSYDRMVESGISKDKALLGSRVSAGLGSLLFSNLQKLIPLPGGNAAGTIEKLGGEEAVQATIGKAFLNYGKDVAKGTGLMAGTTAIDATTRELTKWADGKGVPEAMPVIRETLSAAKDSVGLMSLLGIPGLAGGLTKAGDTWAASKHKVINENEIVTVAAEGKTPSRNQWIKWGLPKKDGMTRNERRAGVAKAAEDIKTQRTQQPTEQPIEAPQAATEQPLAPEQQPTPEVKPQELPPEVKPTEVTQPVGGIKPPELTGVKNELVTELRARRGEDPLDGRPVETRIKMLDKAQKAIDADKNAPSRLVEDLQRKPRAVDESEEAMLQIHYREKNNSFADASNRLVEAQKTNDPIAVAKAQTDANLALEQMRDVEVAARAAHSTWGKTGQAMQIVLKQDFTPENLLRKATVAKNGQPLTVEEGLQVKVMGEKIVELQAKLDSGVAEPKRGFVKETVKRDRAKKTVADAWAEFHAAVAGKPIENIIKGESGALNVDVAKASLKLVKAYVGQGVATVEEFLSNAQGVLGEKYDGLKDNLIEAWAAYQQGSLNKRVQQTSKVLDRSIAQLEKDLAEGKIGFKKKPEPVSTPEIDAKRERLQELKDQRQELRDIHNPKPSLEERKSATYTKNLERRLSDWQSKNESMLETGELLPKKEVVDKVLTKQQTELKFQIAQEKQRYLNLEEKIRLSQRTILKKTLDLVPEVANFSRAAMTSIDLSAVLRQGGMLAMGHPIQTAKEFPAMFEALFSKRGEFRSANEINNRPNAPLYKRDGLGLTITEGQMASQEEAYMGNWWQYLADKDVKSLAGKIAMAPIKTLAHGVVGSERAYVTFLNRQRADTYDALTQTLSRSGVPTPAEGKAIADFINAASGRGSLGPAQKYAEGLATVFFAPRFAISRFQLLVGEPIWGGKGTLRTKELIAKEYARSLIGLGTFYGVMAMTFGNKISFEWDSKSSDFGKIRFNNTGYRLDPLAGLSQATVFMNRMIFGQTKKQTGEVEDLYGPKKPFSGATMSGTAGNFMRNKLSPLFGSAADIIFRENTRGEKTTALGVAQNMSTPLSVGDVYNALQVDGIPAKTALSLLTILGMGSQNYEGGGKPKDFAMKIAEHPELIGVNKQTNKSFDHRTAISQIVKQAKKTGLSESELLRGLGQELMQRGHNQDTINKWQQRLSERYRAY